MNAYLRFYYRFLAPHAAAIEQGRVKQATSLLYDHLLDFIGTHTFEDILLGECKWGQGDVSRSVIQTLYDKMDGVLPGNVSWRAHYAFFGRHGFTPAAQELAAERNAHLITLAQLEGDMGRWLRP